jgi:GNAT superfamily N-acetyltransferase
VRIRNPQSNSPQSAIRNPKSNSPQSAESLDPVLSLRPASGDASYRINSAEGYVTNWYQPADKPDILHLNACQYGESELAESDYFDWYYEDNPAGRPVLPVARETTGGQIVGFLWYIPVRLRYFGTSVLAFLGANALVHPDYRGRNIYVTLQAMAVEECIRRGATLLYAFGGPASIKGAKAVGFEAINMPLLVKPFEIEPLAQVRGFGPALRVALSLGWRLAEATVWRPQYHIASRAAFHSRQLEGLSKGNVTLHWEAGFDESFDRFWQQVADKYPIAVVRDRVFLTWRFRSVPFRQYEILAARACPEPFDPSTLRRGSGQAGLRTSFAQDELCRRDGTELIGYALLRCAEIHGVRAGLIMDLLVEPTARGEEAGLLLLAAATRRFREAGMWMAASLMLGHTQEVALLRRAGYVPCPRGLAPRPYLLAIRGCSAQAPPGQMAGQSHHWFVTMANHDGL